MLKFIDQEYMINKYEDNELANDEKLNKFIKLASRTIDLSIGNTKYDNKKDSFTLHDYLEYVKINGNDYTGGFKIVEKADATKVVYENTASFKDEQAVNDFLVDQEIEVGTFFGLTIKQYNAIREATAIQTDFYWTTDFNHSEGSMSISIGGFNSVSENGVNQDGYVVSNAHRILQDNDLLETVEAAEFDFEDIANEGKKEQLFDDTSLRIAKINIGSIN